MRKALNVLKHTLMSAKHLLDTSYVVCDALFIAGAGIVLHTTYRINSIAGAYMAGTFLIVYSIYLANTKRK